MDIKLSVKGACYYSWMTHPIDSLGEKFKKVCSAFCKALIGKYRIKIHSPETRYLINNHPDSSVACEIQLKYRRIATNPEYRENLVPDWSELTICPATEKPQTSDGQEDEQPTCLIKHDTPDKMVMYKKCAYGFDALHRWYIENGKNPVNSNEYIDWNKVKQFTPLRPDDETT